ncbi:MAG: tetratricopeptide repeat protein [Chlorobi bacterium]|nr:tetratricopeptide repeat protein [Chlorobiota bacterium]
MLGNQLFMARNYPSATLHLERALQAHPGNKAILRKLIICYTQIGETERALDAFVSLIKDDIDYIIETNPISDDCPCPEIVFKLEDDLHGEEASYDDNLVLGMLWLYCNAERAWDYFHKALTQRPGNSKIKSVLTIIKTRIPATNPIKT